MKSKKTNGNRPAYAKRVGNIRVTVWENVNDGQTFFNTSVVRRYKDGEDWKETSTFNGLSDISAALFALNAAANYISQREDEQAQEAGEA
ncbi:MAG TPA: hypothetical protein PKD54_12710 [Pirellulaceae bacterium]|nr:hypothetical protein [Pirellulaceae bacterium]